MRRLGLHRQHGKQGGGAKGLLAKLSVVDMVLLICKLSFLFSATTDGSGGSNETSEINVEELWENAKAGGWKPSYAPRSDWPRYVVAKGTPVRESRLSCYGLGVGWFLFIIGFFLATVPCYVGLIVLLCGRIDYREKPGYIACTIAVSTNPSAVGGCSCKSSFVAKQ